MKVLYLIARELRAIRKELQAIRKYLELFEKNRSASVTDVIDEINRETREKGTSPLLL